jgi:hypothetical protein
MRVIPNPHSKLLASAIVGAVGLAVPPDSEPPAGMAVLLLYVPLDNMVEKNPIEIQTDLGLPWAVEDGSTAWLDELVTK